MVGIRIPYGTGVACCAVAALAVAAVQRTDAGGTAAPTHESPVEARATAPRPFSPGSPWNRPIPPGAPTDPGSSEMTTALISEVPVINLREYGVPVYSVGSTTPRYEVHCTKPWGECELGTVPVPDGALPSTGTDSAMVVVDGTSDVVHEFWRYDYNDGAPSVGWGDVSRLTGDGRGSTAVGAGVSRLAGLVRTAEVERGVIDHALVFSTRWCARGEFRYPATKTDGTYTGPGAVPQGARVQLDPAVDVDSLPGITPLEAMLARALQEYGAYNVDCGQAPMAFVFESPTASDPYPGLGVADYQWLPHIPWERLRVVGEQAP